MYQTSITNFREKQEQRLSYGFSKKVNLFTFLFKL